MQFFLEIGYYNAQITRRAQAPGYFPEGFSVTGSVSKRPAARPAANGGARARATDASATIESAGAPAVEPASAPASAPPPMPAGKQVGAVTAAVRVLRHLAESSEALSSNRIARELALNPSTCFNILKTLEFEGLVYCDPETKRHRPGLVLLELAGGVMNKLGYRQMLHPRLEDIARTHRVVATLWVRSGYDRVVLVDTADDGSPSAIKIVMPVGQRVPLLSGALGRCFAGHGGFARAELRKLFQKVRWYNAPAFDTFLEEVAEAEARGYAVDAGNFANGVTTISSPILDREGRPVMALSAVALSPKLDPDTIAATGADLAAAALAARDLVGISEMR